MQAKPKHFSAPSAMFDRDVVDAIVVKNRMGIHVLARGVGNEK